MPKKVDPPLRGIWKQVARAQRIGISGGMSGRGGTWLAVGVGAWGLQRLRSMTVKEDEILLREPLGPGETLTISHETVTRAEDAKRRKQVQREREQLQEQVARAERAAKKARKGVGRAERRQVKAQEAQAKARKRRRRRR